MKINWLLVFALGVLVIMAVMIVDINSRVQHLNTLQQQRGTLSAQVTAVGQTQGALGTALAFATSEVAIIEEAYAEQRLVRPGDVLVVPLAPPGSTPVPTAVPQVAAQPVENWRYWWALFFDWQP